MYCPKCSQLQSSDDMRFCSRCGFALTGVAMLMDNEGVIPQPGGLTVQTVPSSRKKVMAESAIFTAISWAVVIFATLLFDRGGPFEAMAKLAAVLFVFLGLIGLLRFLYGFLFVKDVIVQPTTNAFPRFTAQGALGAASSRNALPAQREFAGTDYPRRENTQEMVPRPSVTENTTRLLQDPPTEQND
jgi:hypothetical protein